jgi:hypothetical protein
MTFFLAFLLAAFPIRMGSGERDLSRYKEYGYNAALLGHVTQLASFDESAPGALPEGSPLRKQIEAARRHFREEAARGKELGIDAVADTDEILLPTAVIEQLGKEVTLDKDPKRVDLDKEAFWELYRAKYREVLRLFPEIRYVMVRTGENYSFLHDGYSGQVISERGVERSQSPTYIRNMQRLINETRRVVVDEFNRRLIWRTWDLGNSGFHANVEVYDKVLAGVKERKGLISAIKFTQTDFWRYNDFNPAIGRGGVDQIVEFQAAREYEGKGAFPNYLGAEHASAIRRCQELGVKGIWVWDFGGGWDGPHLQSDRWVRANIYATAKLAEDPASDPRRLAEQWAGGEFGERAASKVAEMLVLSPDAVLGFRYIAPYSRNHKGWSPARNIMRDDIIRGETVIRDQGGIRILYDGSKYALDEALEEKARAAATVRRMREIFESAKDDIVAARGAQVFDEARNTLVYMETLSAVMSHYVRGMFLYYNSVETGDASIAQKALAELRGWRVEWDRHRNETPKLPGTATPYRSVNNYGGTPDPKGAMAETCEKALAALEARQKR